MTIAYYPITEATRLTDFYNTEFIPLAYYYQVSPDEFDIGVRFHEEKDEPYEDLSDEQFIIAEEQGQIIGFAHVALWRKHAEDHRLGLMPLKDILQERIGLIRFLHYRAGYRAVGQALLEEAERYLCDAGMRQIRLGSYYGYRFHRFCHAFISDRMYHVLALAGMNGYRVTRGWVYTVMPDYQASEPEVIDPTVDVEVIPEPGRGELPNLRLELTRKGERVSRTCIWSAGHTCRAPEAQDLFKIMWFYADKKEHGKGIGRYMMQRMLWEAKQLGYQHASTGMGTGNHRANLLYTNTGFRAVDTQYQLFKDLDDPLPGYAMDMM